ncbi:MAG TPA: methyltransferase domain-containing protein [Candidatus Limnocylindria bacterium]|nr:methyltransferase domain-containing protein [Candidatus Limnocylindria bacterium]
MDLFAALERINRRPAPYEGLDIEGLWTDPHISEQMLRYHLDPSVDAASRSPEVIERSVAWLARSFDLGPGRRVVDLGCGPGLYAARLARSGASVTGVDFSARSIEHARETAEREGSSVSYAVADYLEWEPGDPYDLALMIYCDYGAMGPDQRRRLLERVRALLAPGGAFVFDVDSMAAFEDREEAVAYAPRLMDGFWSAQPYYGFLNTFVYPTERASLDRYVIVEADRTRMFSTWVTYFDPEPLETELGAAGFRIDRLLADVAGAPYDPAAHEFAVVARPTG